MLAGKKPGQSSLSLSDPFSALPNFIVIFQEPQHMPFDMFLFLMHTRDIVAIAQNGSILQQPPQTIVQTHFIVEIVEVAMFNVPSVQIRSVNLRNEDNAARRIGLPNGGNQPIPKVSCHHLGLRRRFVCRTVRISITNSPYHIETHPRLYRSNSTGFARASPTAAAVDRSGFDRLHNRCRNSASRFQTNR